MKQTLEDISFPVEYFPPEVKDLIQKCLQKDPQHRISCEEALQHPVFQVNRGAFGVVNSFRSLPSGQSGKYKKEIVEEPSLTNSVGCISTSSTEVTEYRPLQHTGRSPKNGFLWRQ